MEEDWVDAFLQEAAETTNGWHHFSDPPLVDAECFYEPQMEVLRRIAEED